MPRKPNPTTHEGRVLTAAIDSKGVGGKARVAEAMSVTPGMVSQWASGHRPVPWDRAEELASEIDLSPEEISAEFRRIAEHFRQSQLERLTGDIILASYRDAITKFEKATGLGARSFKPMSEPEHAELLALAVIARMTAPPADSEITVEVEVGHGAKRANRKGSGAAGEHRQEKAGGEGGAKAGQRKERAA